MALKIGILTLPIAENYGGILQAVALYKNLESQGCDVTLIYKRGANNLFRNLIIQALNKVMFINFKNIKTRLENHKKIQKRKIYHRYFIENEIRNISQELFTKNELSLFCEENKFDVVIVGSDQVWRKKYINDKYYKSYFLDFVDSNKTKKVAYAASFGKDCWEGKDDICEISKLLKDFKAISTREKSGMNVCKNTFNIDNVTHVLDPTLLIKKFFYFDIIKKYEVEEIKENCIMSYILDESTEKGNIINSIQKKLKKNSINHMKGFSKEKNIISIPKWLASFANANFVVTDSFHGMIFSIIFEKNFIIIGNKDRGLDRFTSLLTLLKLENRLIFNIDDLKKINLFDSINYISVCNILEKERDKSLEFLLKAIDIKE